jgi:hypothetical protein
MWLARDTTAATRWGKRYFCMWEWQICKTRRLREIAACNPARAEWS